jgi:hypothetical protein
MAIASTSSKVRSGLPVAASRAKADQVGSAHASFAAFRLRAVMLQAPSSISNWRRARAPRRRRG